MTSQRHRRRVPEAQEKGECSCRFEMIGEAAMSRGETASAVRRLVTRIVSETSVRICCVLFDLWYKPVYFVWMVASIILVHDATSKSCKAANSYISLLKL